VNFVGKDARHKFQPASFETQKNEEDKSGNERGKEKILKRGVVRPQLPVK